MVSVIIPCYQQGVFLREAIESVLGQTRQEFEILVIDDGSTDGTAAEAQRFPQVRYVWQRHAGVAAARNRGIGLSRHPYLVFLDADDRLLPTHFATCLHTFETHPEVRLVWGDYRWFGDAQAWHYHHCAPKPDYYGAMLRFGMMGPPATLMVRREALDALGGFREDLCACEDLELWLRIARRYPVLCHHALIAEYRRHEGQASRRWPVLLVGGLQVLREQQRLIRSDPYYNRPMYRQACREGIAHHLAACGEPVLWEMSAALRARRWRTVVANLGVLLRYYPQGLWKLVQRKLTRLAPTS